MPTVMLSSLCPYPWRLRWEERIAAGLRGLIIFVTLSLHVGTSGCGAGRLRAVADALPVPLLRLRGGASGRSEHVHGEETPSVTPDSDAMMQKTEDASPLSHDQLAQLRSLQLDQLLPLGEDMTERFQRLRATFV